jgi:hypothetical protein
VTIVVVWFCVPGGAAVWEFWRSNQSLHALGLLACVVSASAHAQPGVPEYELDRHVQPVQPAPASTSVDTEIITRTLADRGFANVATVVEGQRVFVTFENTRYRDLPRALQSVAAQLLAMLAPGTELVLVPSVDFVPLGTAEYTVPIYRPPAGFAPAAAPERGVSLSLAELPASLLGTRRAGSSLGRVDVVVHPWVEAGFSNLNTVAARVGLAPEARMTIGNGLTVSAQVLLTLHDDLATGESRIRPGALVVNQWVRLPGNVFLSASAGSFNPDRYGGHVEARAYSPRGSWFTGGELALTGEVSYGADDWYYTAVKEPTALVDVGWRGHRSGLVIRATGGVFLASNQGVRLDVLRSFRAAELGFFATKSTEGTNYGLRMRVPLPGRRYSRPGRVRVRPAEAWEWEYRDDGSHYAGRPFRLDLPARDLERWLR